VEKNQTGVDLFSISNAMKYYIQLMYIGELHMFNQKEIEIFYKQVTLSINISTSKALIPET
jgi:hypothetical protein